MKMNQKLRPGFTLVELLVVIVIIATLAGLTAPMVLRQRKKADQTQAINNARQIGMALIEFDTEYGSFPDDSTADTVTENTGTTLTFAGGTANDYFRQLIGANITTSETMFYAKTSYTVKPDDISNTTEEALKEGEVGFGYIIKSGGGGYGTTGNSGRPVVVSPMMEGSGTEFDPDPFDSKLVMLKVDGSVTTSNIDKDKGTKMGGKDFFDASEGSVWGSTGVAPEIAEPAPKN